MTDKLQGQLLISSPRLGDPNFVHTIILMVQHGEDGALGLVLNRPLETTIRDVCEKALEITCELESVLHQGGPCDGPLMVVHTDESGGEIEVIPGVFFTTARDKIEQLIQTQDATAKFFVGYAGWGPGQLESELETGSWLVTPAKHQHVFDAAADGQWSKLMTETSLGHWIDPSRLPEDPSLN